MAGRRKASGRAGDGEAAAGSVGTSRQRPLTHDDVMQAAIRVDPELRRRSELLWLDRSKSTRGPKAAFTPDDVVQMAMQIADEEGLGAVTMNAVASRLGLTTMAIYRYFPSKETLFDAIIDAGLGTPPHFREPRGNWRDELAQWARAKRAMLIARPWIAELPFVAAPHGPNWLSWFEAVVDALSVTGLAAADMGEVLSVMDNFTRGASDTAVSLARARSRGLSDQDWAAAVGADLGRAIGDVRFPKFAALIMAPSGGTPRNMDESFEFQLRIVLDGVQQYVERAALQQ